MGIVQGFTTVYFCIVTYTLEAFPAQLEVSIVLVMTTINLFYKFHFSAWSWCDHLIHTHTN